MSGFKSEDLGIASSFYFAVYLLFATLMTFVMFKRGFATVYTFIWVFSLFRFFGQLCGVVYAALGPDHWKWLIAYLVLGAEGYFALIFAAFRFTCRAQANEFGSSWVLTLGPPIRSFLLRRNFTWGEIFRLILIPANILVIVGGTMLAGMADSDTNNDSTIKNSQHLRTAGQALFLAMTVFAVLLNVYVYLRERVRNHITVGVLCASPFLLVRGIFGVMSIYITAMNYFDSTNYTNAGASRKVTIYEYLMSTTMEFIAACCLMTRFFYESREVRHSIVENLESDKEV